MSTQRHRIIEAPGLAPAIGFAHAVAAAPGTVVYLGGQTAQTAGGEIQGATMAEQFDLAARNLLTALNAAGGRPDHLVSLLVLVTDMKAYRAALTSLGEVWRTHFGRRYPAMALVGVSELFDPAAQVELMGVAVIP